MSKRVAIKEIHLDRKGRRMKAIRFEQKAELRKRYIARIPRWRHPLIGYLVCIPVVALGFGAIFVAEYLIPHFYFSSLFMVLSVVAIALFWGVGPALFAVVLSTLVLDYAHIPPVGQFNLTTWNNMLEILPFLVVGIIIAILTGQRESARLQALYAEQGANERAAELEQTNQELGQANELKDRFLSMASHELKTPITTIRGQAQIALRRISKKPELTTELEPISFSLRRIDEQTERLNSLVNDLLDLSSIRAGKLKLRLNACDLRDICRSVVEEQQSLTNRSILLDLPDRSVTVEADSDRLNQVLVNLVNNAIKYSPEDTPVQVRAYQREHMAVVEVHDQGAGISSEARKHLFETFYRAPEAESSKQSGWGLGLAICKDIIERHHGRIWCESNTGKNTTFIFEIPLK